MTEQDRELVTKIRVSRVLDAMRSLDEWVSIGGELTGWQQHDLDMAFKRIGHKTEKAA